MTLEQAKARAFDCMLKVLRTGKTIKGTPTCDLKEVRGEWHTVGITVTTKKRKKEDEPV